MSLTKWYQLTAHYLLHAEVVGVVAWEILTFVDLALTVFPFKHPSSGPNMSSAARVSCSTIGRFGKRMLSTVASNILRFGCLIVFCIYQARVALDTCYLEYLSLFSSTVIRVVSFSNYLFLVSDCFFMIQCHTVVQTSLWLRECLLKTIGVFRTCFHFGCRK